MRIAPPRWTQLMVVFINSTTNSSSKKGLDPYLKKGKKKRKRKNERTQSRLDWVIWAWLLFLIAIDLVKMLRRIWEITLLPTIWRGHLIGNWILFRGDKTSSMILMDDPFTWEMLPLITLVQGSNLSWRIWMISTAITHPIICTLWRSRILAIRLFLIRFL